MKLCMLVGVVVTPVLQVDPGELELQPEREVGQGIDGSGIA